MTKYWGDIPDCVRQPNYWRGHVPRFWRLCIAGFMKQFHKKFHTEMGAHNVSIMEHFDNKTELIIIICCCSNSLMQLDDQWQNRIWRHCQRCQVPRFWRETPVFRRPLRPPVWQGLSPVFTFSLYCQLAVFDISTVQRIRVRYSCFESTLMNSNVLHAIQYYCRKSSLIVQYFGAFSPFFTFAGWHLCIELSGAPGIFISLRLSDAPLQFCPKS